MGITFACGRCGHWFEVDASLAGRHGRCKRCGHVNVVPPEEDEDGVYALEGVAEASATTEAEVQEAIFVRAPSDPEPPPAPARRRRKKPARKVRSERAEPEPTGPGAWRGPVRLALGAGAILHGVALLVPGGTMIAGIALAVVGLLGVGAGYAVAAYAAFQEDALYGWLFLLIPLYAGYYIVSRWDVMWPWFGAMAAGAAVLVLAGWVLGVGLDRVGPAKEARPEEKEVRVIEPAGARPVVARVGA